MCNIKSGIRNIFALFFLFFLDKHILRKYVKTMSIKIRENKKYKTKKLSHENFRYRYSRDKRSR